MQENNMYVGWFSNLTPTSTEHDLADMLSQQEAFIESELGETYFAMKQEMEDE